MASTNHTSTAPTSSPSSTNTMKNDAKSMSASTSASPSPSPSPSPTSSPSPPPSSSASSSTPTPSNPSPASPAKRPTVHAKRSMKSANNNNSRGGDGNANNANNPIDDKEILQLLNHKIDSLENTTISPNNNNSASSSSAAAASSSSSSSTSISSLPPHKDESESSTISEQEQVRIRHREILESLPSLPSIEDRIAHLMHLISHEYERRLVVERQCSYYKNTVQRIIKQRDRLEGLCRELQKRNKLINEEINRVSVDQQRQHTQLREKFESSLSDIQTQLKKHSEERDSQLSENSQLREKIGQLLKYESVREEHFQHQLRTKELEVKLLEAKLSQQAEYAAGEAKKYLLSEKKNRMSKDRIDALLASEESLRNQLQSYGEKFEQVQSTLTKSNELFATFKGEMEKMNSSMKRLEMDKNTLAKKNQESQVTIRNLKRTVIEQQLKILELQKKT